MAYLLTMSLSACLACSCISSITRSMPTRMTSPRISRRLLACSAESMVDDVL